MYSGVVVWIELDVLKLGADSKLKNLSILHTLLTFVISTLLVFRTNTAYERWWDGRKFWGALVNSSRNLSLKLHAMLPIEDRQTRLFFGTMIGNFPILLKNHLRDEHRHEKLHDNHLFNRGEINAQIHAPMYLTRKLFDVTIELKNAGKFSSEDLLFLNAELMSFADICGACERIKSTPIPYSYSSFMKKFIFFFVMTLPLTLSFSLGYNCIPVIVFIFYVLASLEFIAEEIEDPFGKDQNDLPLESISKKIRKSVYEILEIPELP